MFSKAVKPKGKGENYITCQTFRSHMPSVASTSSKICSCIWFLAFYIKLFLTLATKILEEK
jgi:hypothetical protein